MSALRLGASEVTMVCLEQGHEIPAYAEEIEQAVSAGIKIVEGWGPTKVLGNNQKVSGVDLVRCSSAYDENGNFCPCYDEQSTRSIEADSIIFAIGQAPDSSVIPVGLKQDNGFIPVDQLTFETCESGVFAGGDIVGGSGTVVKAIAEGKAAAISIERYVKGEDLSANRQKSPKVANPPKDGMPMFKRNAASHITVPTAAENYEELKEGFDVELADQEVQRCMTCGSRSIITYKEECRLCKSCETNCPTKAIYSAPLRKIEPQLKMADTLDEIAEWIGADPEVLKKTIEEYNTDCDRGCDSLFAKDRKYMVPLRKPPYYAVKANSDFLDTCGGLKVNENMEVINKKDEKIPGLYAAGVIAGGWHGDTYNVILSGAMSGFAFNSGRIAAESVVKVLNSQTKEHK